MSYSYLVVNLKSPIEDFSDFKEDNISEMGFDESAVRKCLLRLYPGITWSDEENGISFGKTPCLAEPGIEAWLHSRTHCLSVSVNDPKEVVEIAKQLGLYAFDVEGSLNCLYSPLS